MKSDRSSWTASWVAACRSLGALLPPDAQLVNDPYGLSFASGSVQRLGRWMLAAPRIGGRLLPYTGPLAASVAWMQLRTRAIDDDVRRFAAEGGTQFVLLGAGFDARAHRLRDVVGEGRVFEVDHPATQSRKRAALREHGVDDSHVRYVSWNFESRAMDEMPAALERDGLDVARPVHTIWEGVTMYLTEQTIEATVDAIGRWSCAGSRLALTYFDLARIEGEGPWGRVSRRFVRWVGEPFTFGWRPDDVGPWFAKRGFDVDSNSDGFTLARTMLPAEYVRYFRPHRGFVATAKRSAR